MINTTAAGATMDMHRVMMRVLIRKDIVRGGMIIHYTHSGITIIPVTGPTTMVDTIRHIGAHSIIPTCIRMDTWDLAIRGIHIIPSILDTITPVILLTDMDIIHMVIMDMVLITAIITITTVTIITKSRIPATIYTEMITRVPAGYSL